MNAIEIDGLTATEIRGKIGSCDIDSMALEAATLKDEINAGVTITMTASIIDLCPSGTVAVTVVGVSTMTSTQNPV